MWRAAAVMVVNNPTIKTYLWKDSASVYARKSVWQE
jgi:hypothetical protein